MSFEEFIEIASNFQALDKHNIQNIVSWVVSSPTILEDEIEKKLSFYEINFKNPQIFEVLLLLIQRYKMVHKSKEELMKFLFRKSFKFIKHNFEDNHKGMLRKQLNFKFNETYLTKEGEKKAKEMKTCNYMTKTFLMKKISNRFLKVLFSNENFFTAFEEFLNIFDEFAKKENQRKVVKIVGQIMMLVQKNKIAEIKIIQHLPWIQIWMEKSKLMGDEIIKTIKGSSFSALKLKKF